MAGLNGRDGRDSRPVPDPTALTQELVDSAIDGLERVIDERIKGLDKVYETRFSATAEAVKLLQTIQDRMPAEADVKTQNLEKLLTEKLSGVVATHDEKFKAIDNRFLDKDEKVKEAKADAKVGIDAALASAEKLVGQSNVSFKEAVEKAEKSTEKLLEKQTQNQETTAKSLEDKIAGLKERVDRFEGIAAGVITAKADVVTTQTFDRGGNQFNLSLVMAVVTIASVAFGIVMALR